MARSDTFDSIAKAMAQIDFCMMQTVGPDGVATRPMSNNGDVEYDGDTWFFSHADANKVAQITADGRVHLTFADHERVAFVSVWGTGEVVADVAMKQKHWHEGLEQWFENGPEDPSVALLRVSAHKIQTWGSLGDHLLDLA